MECVCGNMYLKLIKSFDEIIDDKAIIHHVYYCSNCKSKVETEILGEINFWFPEEITKVEYN